MESDPTVFEGHIHISPLFKRCRHKMLIASLCASINVPSSKVTAQHKVYTNFLQGIPALAS